VSRTALTHRSKRPSIAARAAGSLARVLVLFVGIAACNSILDNERGVAQKPTETSPTQPLETDGGPPRRVETDDDEREASAPPAPVDDGGGTTPPCAPGERTCNGICVKRDDPLYGCGAESCAPCKLAHGTPMCRGDKCAVATCDPGYADCNQNGDDGCETDLSRAATCGSCNAVCPLTAPVCAPTAGTFQCTTGCSAAAPLLCGAECVSPLTSVNHCGGCNLKCPEVDHATVECVTGQCKFTCKAGYHACAGKCFLTTDPMACGPSCGACPVGANAAAVCQADTCSMQCNVGFGDCNHAAADGCEANFATDPRNCGGCGKACDGGVCRNGLCG
jgi:hypothetical protein